MAGYISSGHFSKALDHLTPAMRHYHRAEQAWLRQFVRAGDTVVDIGCGTGRVTTPLAALVGSEGFVHGVEREDSLLALARAQTRQCGNVRLHHTDIREFSRLGSWSAAVAVLAWNFIGCITEDERAAALESSMSIVTGGGLLVGTAYSEDAWQAQREQYESNGARVAKIDERFVHCPQMGFRSERFAKPSLEQLLGAYGPVRVERISPIAYGYVIERICHEACA